MPELPEVETTCAGIRPHLLGNSVCSVEVLETRLRWPVAQEIEQLRSQVVLSVSRRAKFILIEFPEGSIIAHLGMSGSLRISRPETELKKHDHLIFHLSSGEELRYHDPRRFGCMLWSKDPENHKLLRQLGPEPLEDQFTSDYLLTKAKSSNCTIKQFIMNNQVVVGVGNIYACESLFLAGISPTRKARNISKGRIENLVTSIRSTLSKAIQQGGTTLRDFVNEKGEPGYFQQELFVYNREGQSCKRCQAEIKRRVVGQRSTFYCPKCQR